MPAAGTNPIVSSAQRAPRSTVRCPPACGASCAAAELACPKVGACCVARRSIGRALGPRRGVKGHFPHTASAAVHLSCFELPPLRAADRAAARLGRAHTRRGLPRPRPPPAARGHPSLPHASHARAPCPPSSHPPARKLGQLIAGWLADARAAAAAAAPAAGAAPRAVIAPHAGHRYCGHVMAHAYAAIEPAGV